MNGEIHQGCNIVISARKSLFENKGIDFKPTKHILSIEFLFAPKFLVRKAVEAKSVVEWFDICLKRGLKDIKFVTPSNRENKHLIGFANTSNCAVLCYWKNGKISSFSPWWEFDQEKTKWKIHYKEQFVNKIPVFKNLHFTDRTEDFKQILLDIGKFATEIEHPYFSDVFNSAYQALCGEANISDGDVPEQLPDEFKSIYYAVDKADVFGAMGSWNDSPPYYAHQKGLEKEYNELSNRLIVELRYHLMYVTNECWKKD